MKYNYDVVIKLLKNGYFFRFIGDNINILVGVKYERFNVKGIMYNWFVLVIVI